MGLSDIDASVMQTWLITGSSRGLGRALADAVLASGHNLVATARDAVAAGVDAFGRLDVLVNNAGYGNVGSIEDTSVDEFRAQIETNLFGVINVTKAVIPIMREQGSGRAARHQGHDHRAGRLPHRLRRCVDDDSRWAARVR